MPLSERCDVWSMVSHFGAESGRSKPIPGGTELYKLAADDPEVTKAVPYHDTLVQYAENTANKIRNSQYQKFRYRHVLLILAIRICFLNTCATMINRGSLPCWLERNAFRRQCMAKN